MSEQIENLAERWDKKNPCYYDSVVDDVSRKTTYIIFWVDGEVAKAARVWEDMSISYGVETFCKVWENGTFVKYWMNGVVDKRAFEHLIKFYKGEIVLPKFDFNTLHQPKE